MSVPAAIRTEGSGGPALGGGTPSGPLRTVLSLARTEALLLLRSVLVLAGLAGGAAAIWRSVWSAEPLWWNTAWQIGYGQVILAVVVLAAAQLATGRARRDGMRDLYDSFPVSAATRTLGHLGGLAGVLPASVMLAGAAAVVGQARGAVGVPSAGVLAAGVLLVVAAGAAGVAVGTRFPHPLAGILAAMVLLVVFTQSYRLLAYPALGGAPWLFPWTAPDQLGALPGPLAGTRRARRTPWNWPASRSWPAPGRSPRSPAGAGTGRRWRPPPSRPRQRSASAVPCSCGPSLPPP